MDILGCHECEKGGDLEDPEGLMGFVLLLTKSLPEGEGFFSAHSETTLSRESRNVFRDLNGRGQAPKGRLRIAGGERFPASPRFERCKEEPRRKNAGFRRDHSSPSGAPFIGVPDRGLAQKARFAPGYSRSALRA